MKRFLLVLFIFLTAGASLCSAGEPVYRDASEFPVYGKITLAENIFLEIFYQAD